MTRFTVVLDACVLYPSLLRDALMHLSMTNLFKARWTEKIHEEWIRSLLSNRPDLTMENLLKTKDLMNAHALDANITGFESLERCIELPDPDDRHVVAAAIKSNSDAIVTFNLKDFPAKVIDQFDIEVIHPDDFISYQIDLSAPLVCKAIKKMRLSCKSPPYTPAELLLALEKNQLPITASMLSEYQDSI